MQCSAVRRLIASLIHHPFTHPPVHPFNYPSIHLFHSLTHGQADFGLAKRMQNPDIMSRTFCGTLNFMAPEMQARKEHGLGVDIYGKMRASMIACIGSLHR